MQRLSTILLICSIIALACLLASSTCTGGRGMSEKNESFVYKKDPGFLQPEYSLRHESEGVSILYYRIHASDLLYSKEASTEKFIARFSFSWTLREELQSKFFLDSGTVVAEDLYNNDPERILEGQFKINIPAGRNYSLEIDLYDINRMQDRMDHLAVEKTNIHQRQNFNVKKQVADRSPLFKPEVKLNESCLISHRADPKVIYVRYYNREFNLPPPPFSYYTPKGFDFKPDSFFILEPGEAGFVFKPARHGIYHIQVDSSQVDGLTLICFKENFPRFKTYEAMIHPLRYLTSKNEYDKMMRNPNRKAAVDSFWLSSGGNIDRGKDLVRKFYNRVYESNDHFTSFQEGWRTDRGLVYVVYGPPNVLYRNGERETWVYGEENNLNSLTFTFTRVINPFSDNDYRLERSPTYQDGWYKAANAWRDGRIFIDN